MPRLMLQKCGFNPLIGGADRATAEVAARAKARAARQDAAARKFQSPHRRGGSRDIVDNDAYTGTNFHGFNPLIGGADRATRCLPRGRHSTS